MLMDEKTATLSELLVACREAADHYRMTAERADEEAALASMLRDHGEDHDRHADALADALREAGQLPRVPDPEWEGVTELANRLREALSVNDKQAMVDECVEAENALAALILTAQNHEHSSATQQILQAVGDDVAAHGQQLDNMADQLEDKP